jgi:RNA polymerase sigma factor (TIGR02999 family)
MKEITQLLNEWRGGSHEAENELFQEVMPRLRRLAQHLMLGEKPGQSIQATELVDQVYLGMVATKDRDWQNRGHFFALAARAMRHHLIDRARRPHADKVSIDALHNVLPAAPGQLDLAVTVDRLLNEMHDVKPDWCRVVEVKYFLGLTDDEAASILGMPVRTLQRAWRDARKWLFERMEPAGAGSQ